MDIVTASISRQGEAVMRMQRDAAVRGALFDVERLKGYLAVGENGHSPRTMRVAALLRQELAGAYADLDAALAARQAA